MNPSNESLAMLTRLTSTVNVVGKTTETPALYKRLQRDLLTRWPNVPLVQDKKKKEKRRAVLKVTGS
jgi:hypothetical protein